MVDQEFFGDDGDCMRACVASYFGYPLKEVPHFARLPVSECWKYFYKFFSDHDLDVVMIPFPFAPNCDYFASGSTDRESKHMVLMRDGELLHDPHPSRAGLRKITAIYLAVPRVSPQLEG